MTSSSRTTEGEKTSTSGLACDYALISIMSTLKKQTNKQTKRLIAGYSGHNKSNRPKCQDSVVAYGIKHHQEVKKHLHFERRF